VRLSVLRSLDQYGVGRTGYLLVMYIDSRRGGAREYSPMPVQQQNVPQHVPVPDSNGLRVLEITGLDAWKCNARSADLCG
jgi:hypothetical protein